MRIIILSFFILTTVLSSAQQIEVEEQSIEVCFMDDPKRDVIAVTKAVQEIEGLKIEAYFDSSSPMSGPCADSELGKYKPNSVKINNELLQLSSQINGNNTSRYNIGRFFYAEQDKLKYITFELSDIGCPNVADQYCYLIICLNEKNKLGNHIFFQKEHNPMSEEELSRIIGSIFKDEMKKRMAEKNAIK